MNSCFRNRNQRFSSAHMLHIRSHNRKNRSRLKDIAGDSINDSLESSETDIAKMHNSSRPFHNPRPPDPHQLDLEICQNRPDAILSFPTNSIEIPQILEVPSTFLESSLQPAKTGNPSRIRTHSRQFNWTNNFNGGKMGSKCQLKRQPVIKLTKKDVEHIRVSWN